VPDITASSKGLSDTNSFQAIFTPPWATRLQQITGSLQTIDGGYSPDHIVFQSFNLSVSLMQL
jgi:hypothetical protein